MIAQTENKKKILKIKEISSVYLDKIKSVHNRQSKLNSYFLKKIEEKKIKNIRDNIKY